MGKLQERHTISGPFIDFDPVDSAILFLRTNRYRLSETETGPPPVGLEITPRDQEGTGEDAESSEDVVKASEDVADASEELAESSEDVVKASEDVADSSEELADSSEDLAESSEDVVEASEDVADSSEELADSSEDLGESSEDVVEASEDVAEASADLVESSEDLAIPEDAASHDDEAEPAEPDPAREIAVRCKMHRGEKGRGWFSSDLSELQTQVTVRLDGGLLVVEYEVDTSGQLLSEDEKGFWRREVAALGAYLKGTQQLENLAERESDRAQEIHKDFLQMGLWAGAVVAAIIFIAGMLYFRQ